MRIETGKLLSRSIIGLLDYERQLAGIKMDGEKFTKMLVFGGIALFVLVPFLVFLFTKLGPGIAIFAGFAVAGMYEGMVYAYLELLIEQRRNYVENLLPDYLQLTAANMRSGIALDKAMILAARPEFGHFSEEIRQMNKQLYGGITLQESLMGLAKKYRAPQLQHTVRMMSEGIRYGGGMTDLLNQISKDIRNQQMVQKEISGQLFMYTIFIAFAALVGAPVLYALTAQMIKVTDTVWAGILKQNPGGLPSVGVSFLRPSPPKITISAYSNFALAAVILVSGFGAFIVSVIASGSALRGLRYLPVFLLIGLVMFFLVSAAIGGIFTTISGTGV